MKLAAALHGDTSNKMVAPFNLLMQVPVPSRGRRVNKSPDYTYDQEYYLKNADRLRAAAKVRRAANPELVKARNRANYKKRRKKILAKQREFYANNKAYVIAKNAKHRKAYRERHRERLNEQQKKRYRDNPDLKIQKRELQRRDRARKRLIDPKTYMDQAVCPVTGQMFEKMRLVKSVGKAVRTLCSCGHIHRMVAGPTIVQAK